MSPRKHNPDSAAKVRCWNITTPTARPASETPPESANPVETKPGAVRHGYTMRDLDRLARRVITAHLGWWSGGDRADQYDTAWSGIAEHLCSAAEPPSESDLTAAGTRALDQDVKASQRHHGSDRAGGIGPRFAAYWHELPAEPWEERLIDRIAAGQVLDAASPADRRAVTVLAALYGDRAAAAAALGITDRALAARLCRARAVCRLHWYAPDTAPPMKRPVTPGRAPTGTHCSQGHELTPDNITWMAPRSPGRPRYGRCRTCEKQRATERRVERAAVPEVDPDWGKQ